VWAGVGVLVAALVLCLAPADGAQDVSSAIAEAEGHAAAAAAEVEELTGELAPAKADLAAARRRAAPLIAELHATTRRIATLKAQAHTSRTAAAAHIRRIEESNSKAAEKHEEKVTSGIGIGLGLLLVAVVVLAWGWFRASAAVAALTRLPLAQAIGICVGGGLLALFVGAALGSGAGVLAALGSMLATLGLTLPAAFLLARHSAEVQRGRSRALLRRERLPLRAMQALAAVIGVFCLTAFGSALFAPAAESEDVTTALRASAAARGADTPELAQAESALRHLEAKAGPAIASLHHEEAASAKAGRTLRHAEARMVGAERRARRLSRRLVALEVRERHDQEREERRAQKALEQEEREYAEAAEEEAAETEELAAEECNPNYSGCLDPNASDYDCEGGSGDGPDYTGTVEVLGYDEYGLDADGDGIGIVEHRIQVLTEEHSPALTAVGRAGFDGYLIFGYPDKHRYVLESLDYGNATYVFGENWEALSQLTKREIIADDLHLARIIHRQGWAAEIADVLA
jgi:hypothetical protein